jgi:hypothetical protein
VFLYSEMEFWDKLLESFTPCDSQSFFSDSEFLKKIRLYSGFKNLYIKNLRNKKTRVFSWIAPCRKGNGYSEMEFLDKLPGTRVFYSMRFSLFFLMANF